MNTPEPHLSFHLLCLNLAVLWYWGMFSFSTIWPVANLTQDSAINKAADVQPDITLSDRTIKVQPDLTVSETKPQVNKDPMC